MTFKNNKFTLDSFEKTPFYVALNKKLAVSDLSVTDIDLHGSRATRVRGKASRHVELFISGGIEVDLFIADDGDVVRLLVDNQIMNDFDDEAPSDLADDISKEVIRRMKHKAKQALREKVKASEIDKLLSDEGEVDDDVIKLKRLKQHKANITKGSGKFIVINEFGEMLQDDGGFSLSTLYVKVFDTLEDAKAEVNENKIVKV